jgi:hypothetical protein
MWQGDSEGGIEGKRRAREQADNPQTIPKGTEAFGCEQDHMEGDRTALPPQLGVFLNKRLLSTYPQALLLLL